MEDGATSPGEAWDEDEWTAEDERRYQLRRSQERAAVRRRRRQAGVFALLVLVVLGAGTTAAGVYQGWWEWPPWSGQVQPEAGRTVGCPTPDADPAPAGDVTLAVLNSTSRTGLAVDTAALLAERGFIVGSVGNDTGAPVAGTAVVRHGPAGLPAATTVAAHVPDAQLLDDGREGAAVELSLGEAFAGLRPPEEAAALLDERPTECAAPGSPATTAPPAPTG